MVRARDRRGESRWPAAISTLAAIDLYGALPSSLVVGPRYVVPSLELLFLAVVIAFNPGRMTRMNRLIRTTTLILTGLILVTNLVSLALLLRKLVVTGTAQGPTLLLAALQVWLTNVI